MKNNISRKKHIMTLLGQGVSGPDIRDILGISVGVWGHNIDWLVAHGFLRRVGRGTFVPTGKTFPEPHNGQTELIGRAGDLYIISRRHPRARGEVDYLGATIREDHLEIRSVGLETMMQSMVRYPTALPLTAVTLANLQAAVGQG